eukprot:gene21020-23073_t
MWSLKACTVPVIVGVFGMIKKGTEKTPRQIPALGILCLPKVTGVTRLAIVIKANQ